MPYDPEVAYTDKSKFDEYYAIDKNEARKYGKVVKATLLSNREYQRRFDRQHKSHRMKEPPSNRRIFEGYLVVRKLKTRQEYETWMPVHVFNEIYCASKTK